MDLKKGAAECKRSFRKSRNLIRSLVSLLVFFNRFNLRSSSSSFDVSSSSSLFFVFVFIFHERKKTIAVSCVCILQLLKSKSSLLLACGVKKTRQRCWSFKISSNFKHTTHFNETTTAAPWHWVNCMYTMYNTPWENRSNTLRLNMVCGCVSVRLSVCAFNIHYKIDI